MTTRRDSRPKATDWFWLAWLVAFLCVEIPAAIRKRGGTFSEFCWRVFKVTRHMFRGSWRRWPLVAFAADLCLHLGWEHSAYPLMVTGAMVGGIIAWWFVRERSSVVVAFALFASPAFAQVQSPTDAPTFWGGFLWKQAIWQGVPAGEAYTMARSDTWGGRLVGGLGLGRVGLELRLDASGLQDQFDVHNPATYQSLEAYALGHFVVASRGGLQVGPAIVVGSVSAFEAAAPWSGFGVDVVGAGLRVGGHGSELEILAARTSFLRDDPSIRLVAVAHVRLTDHLAVVADAVSGPAGFIRGGLAVEAFRGRR
jgi:hypothetical protein